MTYTLIRGARQVLTLRGDCVARRGDALRELGIVENGCVLVRGDAVAAVGRAAEIEKLPEARHAREIDAAGKVVMPGFVDSHTHLAFGVPRLADYEMRLGGASYEEIAAAGGGILCSMRAVRAMPAAALERQARGALDAMARHGTTTVEAKSGYGLDEAAEIKTLEIYRRLGVLPTYLGAHVTPPEHRDSPDSYVQWLCDRMLPLVGERQLACFADVYCDRGAFTVEQARRYFEQARASGLLLKIHAEQFTRSGAAQLAVEWKATSADHLDRVEENDIRALAKSDTVATLLPGAVFHLGAHCYPPARALIDAGAAVALATDFNPGTSPTCSMQMVVSLACTQMRMTPAEAISAATINGAHALASAGRVGSLEPGKQADLIVLHLSDYRELPYYFGANHVQLTMKGGKTIP